MSKRFDATPKFLLELGPRDWLALIGRPTSAPVTIEDADLSTVTSQADKILRVGEPSPWLVHFEPFSGRDPDAPRRMCRYSILAEVKFNLPVWTVVILLRPEADSPELTGNFRRVLPDGTCYDEFRYQVIRVWKIPLEELLTGGIATLPLAPIGDIQTSQLPEVISRMRQRVEVEVPAHEQGDFWTATGVLLGARYNSVFVKQLLKGITNMRESSIVQEFLEEGRREGIQTGIQSGIHTGSAMEARRILLRLGTARLGKIDTQVQAYLETVTEIEDLERLVIAVASAQSWLELLPSQK